MILDAAAAAAATIAVIQEAEPDVVHHVNTTQRGLDCSWTSPTLAKLFSQGEV